MTLLNHPTNFYAIKDEFLLVPYPVLEQDKYNSIWEALGAAQPDGRAATWVLVEVAVNKALALTLSESRPEKLYSSYVSLFESASISPENVQSYVQLFESNNIDLHVDADNLDDAALKELGVTAWGDRKKILKELEKHSVCDHPPPILEEDAVTPLADWLREEGVTGRQQGAAVALAETIAKQDVFLKDLLDQSGSWSAADLEQIGVRSLGQQRRILAAIQRAKLRGSVDPRLLVHNV